MFTASVKVTTQPADKLFVSLVEAKAWLHVTHSSEDTLITSLIARAYDTMTRITGQSINSTSYRLTTRGVERCISLPYSPLASITDVSWRDIDGADVVIPNTNYWAETDMEPGELIFNDDGVDVLAATTDLIGLVINYVGAQAATPDWVELHGLQLIAAYWANRPQAEINTIVEQLLGYRIEVL